MRSGQVWILLILVWVAAPAVGQDGDKPFAEAHIVLQLSDRDPEIQKRVINVANNLVKHYGGPDFVDVEIVAFGPGLSLLYPDNSERERIASLVSSGVRFVGCMNTAASIERQTGKRPELIDETIPTQTGVAHIVERVSQGFVLVRP